jgi:NAD(P)-dependent dehydrogenase (short-subunit alcohol dehydrogenase family)
VPVLDYPSKLRLDERGFVVIGAGQGIGEQAAHAIASAGARVLCVDRDPARAEHVAAQIDGHALAVDVTKRENVEAVIAEATAHFHRLDGVIDIVGFARWGALLNIDDESWDAQFDACLRHAFLAMQLGARVMQASGGVMAFVGSITGIGGAPAHAAYGAAKAGLMSLVRSAAVEFGPLGIRVNAVAPGATATPRIVAGVDAEQRARHAAIIPTRRLNSPADVAGALLFLVSDLSANITGQTLVVDGGVTLLYPFA